MSSFFVRLSRVCHSAEARKFSTHRFLCQWKTVVRSTWWKRPFFVHEGIYEVGMHAICWKTRLHCTLQGGSLSCSLTCFVAVELTSIIFNCASDRTPFFARRWRSIYTGNIKRYISKLRLCLPYELSRKIANWMLLDNKKRYNRLKYPDFVTDIHTDMQTDIVTSGNTEL